MDAVQIQRGDGSFVTCEISKRSLSYYRYHVTFTPIEWKILTALYEKKGTVVARDELLSLLWGKGNEIPTRTVDVHISSIRKKLSYIKGARIDSVYGKGYRFVFLSRF